MNTKLAYLCSSKSWGGLEMNHLRNAHWMKERGHSVLVLCQKNTPIEKHALELNLPIQCIDSHKKYYDFKAAKKLTSILKQNNVTHLLIRSNHDMSITATVKRKLKNTIHTAYFMEMQLGVKKKGIGHTIRYKYIDTWACPLHWLSKQVEELTNFKNHLAVIPSGIELSHFNSTKTQSECREQLGIPRDNFTFGLIGRLDPQKGQLLLLKSMLLTKNKSYNIVLLGEPTLHEGDKYLLEINEFIEEHQLQNRVFIRPFRKDTFLFYKAINYLIMATKAETFGMVTVESMACGTPVLGSNAGGTVELISNAPAGMLFETQNANDLALKMDEIIADNNPIDQSAFQSYISKFDHNKVCESVEDLLKLADQNKS